MKKKRQQESYIANGRATACRWKIFIQHVRSNFKKRIFVYSWKLERHDKMPEGKKADLSLREKEKLLERDLAMVFRYPVEI